MKFFLSISIFLLILLLFITANIMRGIPPPSRGIVGKNWSTRSKTTVRSKRGCPLNPRAFYLDEVKKKIAFAAPSRGLHRRGLSNDDSSSTKTEIEEMDQFSDLEDNAAPNAGDQGAGGDDTKTAKVIKFD